MKDGLKLTKKGRQLMNKILKRLIRSGDALSQLCNVVFFDGHPNESMSGRSWRTRSMWYKVIDALLFFDKDHCRVSYENDVKYAKELLKQFNENNDKKGAVNDGLPTRSD